MIEVLEDFQVCTDCHLGIAGHSEEELGRELIDFGKHFTPGVHYVTGELISEFSSMTCSSCGTDDAGERYSAFGLGEADSTTKAEPIVGGMRAPLPGGPFDDTPDSLGPWGCED